MRDLRIEPGIGAWRPRCAAAVACLLAVLAILCAPRVAAADDKPTLSGSWTASALTESWSATDWGEVCGPKPAAHGAGGGAVQIREQGGELSIIGAGRAFSTAECWEQMPGLARTSHSASGGGRFWRTRCTTPANDPRRAAVTTTISATDTSIQLNESGEYQWSIKDATCRASVTRSRSFSLVRREGDTPPAARASGTPSATPAPPAPPPAPEPRTPTSSRCAGSAGEPARLEVHPSRKLMRAGDKFAFRAVVLDAEGCPTGTRPTWSIAPGPLAGKATVDPSGTLAVAADAGEGKLEVSVSVGGKGLTVQVDVATPEHYDTLLGVGGLNDAGEGDQPAVAVIAAGTIGGRTGVAQDAARERKTLFVAIVAALAVALGFVALVLTRRGARPLEAVDGETDGAGPEASDEAPPSSGAEPSSQGATAGTNGGRSPAAPPVAAQPKPAKARTAGRGKICPTCGDRYPSDAEFCGKDATQLVPLN